MPAGRDSAELAASVGEISGMADSEESITILARKVFMRLFEVTGFRSALALFAAGGRLWQSPSTGCSGVGNVSEKHVVCMRLCYVHKHNL